MARWLIYTIAVIFPAFTTVPVKAQNVEYIKVPELETLLNNGENKLYVINFWATWCAPCIKEFPLFEKVSKEYNENKVKFIMISLDFPSQIEKQLIPFLKRNNSSLNVVVMMDIDYNSWIDKVDPSWQGEIPATLVLNNSKRQRLFHRGELNESLLREMINSYL